MSPARTPEQIVDRTITDKIRQEKKLFESTYRLLLLGM